MTIVGTNLIYELVQESTIGTTVSNNILYYFNDDPTPSDPASNNLLIGWVADVIPEWIALINSKVKITRLLARRLNNLTDFAETGRSDDGLVVGDNVNNFTAFRINKARTTKSTRSGWVNIMGVSQVDTEATGQTLEPAAVARLDALAVSLNAVIVETVNTFKPVIVGNKVDTSTDPPTLRPEADWVFNLISSTDSLDRVTSQVSRK